MRLLIVSALIHVVSGHGYISNPPAQFYSQTNKTTYNGITTEAIDPAFQGLKWNDSPDNNLKTFTSAFSKSKFKTLKQMVDAASVGCGGSRTDVSPVLVNNMNSMSWQNDEYKEGFIFSHSGPCEAWLDGKRVARSDDCRTSYPGYPATIPIDYSSCKGRCLLEFYWLALHEPNWQLYKQCVPVIRTGGNPCQCSCKE